MTNPAIHAWRALMRDADGRPSSQLATALDLLAEREAASLERAQAGCDERFERKLADALVRAIVDQSMIDDLLVIRTGESAAALITALASILALSPAATHSRAAIKQTADGFRRKLAAKVRAAEGSPNFYEFRRRAFRNDDRERGG